MAGKALGLVLKALGPRERQRLRKSFRQAAEACRLGEEERARQETRRGRARNRFTKAAGATARAPGQIIKRVSKPFRTEPQKDQVAPIAEGNGAKEAFKTVSSLLTKAWADGSLAESRWLDEQAQGTWIWFLEECLRGTAKQHRMERVWRYVVGGDSEKSLDDSVISRWAQEMAREIMGRWTRDPQLRIVAAQLNLESGLGLQGALVAVSREISARLLWIALSVAAMTLLGGGGIALLVLLIDKG